MSLKKWIRIVLDVIDLIQFFLMCPMLEKFSGVSSEKEKENFGFCSPTS